MAPLVLAMRRDGTFTPRVCVSAQHREMLDQVLGLFSIKPVHDLGIMKQGQGLFDITTRGLSALDKIYDAEKPDMVIVQGDTTTAFVAALAAFYKGIHIAHVEAGLRTWDKLNPFPEEMNRTLITHLADMHFAPTSLARDNLIKNGVPRTRIRITGNTVVDALRHVEGTITRAAEKKILKSTLPLNGGGPIVLVTAHRRESFGAGMTSVLSAIKALTGAHPDVEFVFPVHPNPNVRAKARSTLKGIRNIRLTQPLDYRTFVCLMHRSYLLLTDSGGIQEEACYLGKPVVVLRQKTERGEAVSAGSAVLVGTDKKKIVSAVSRLLRDASAHSAMARKTAPFGSGNASIKILASLKKFFA